MSACDVTSAPMVKHDGEAHDWQVEYSDKRVRECTQTKAAITIGS